MQHLHPSFFFDLSQFQHAALFASCTYVWEALKKLEEYLENLPSGFNEAKISDGAFLIDPEKIFIGKGSIVEPGAYIKGPCYIGEGCVVRHGAYIRGYLLAGNDCVIGHDTEVKHAILLDSVRAGHFAYVGDTILGSRVNLGAGTKCANLKLNAGPIAVNVNGEHISTGFKKFGAVLGDDVQTGCNSVTNPGTLVGKNTICYPCVNFGGFVGPKQTIKSNMELVITPRHE